MAVALASARRGDPRECDPHSARSGPDWQTGPILAPAAKSGKARIVGGLYHLADGRMELLG
jgi:hypothetical protein